MVFVAAIAYLGRGGYDDAAGDGVDMLDAFYYATVSITTTGYGDVRPVSDEARLLNVLLVTPARILFLILLVGTTLEVLTERTRQGLLRNRWRKKLQDHVIVCGYGTKGRTAIEALLGKEDFDQSQVVVIDDDPEAINDASASGFAAIHGTASSTAVLHEAGIRNAKAVIVAPRRDDTSVLITLTARELNRTATIVAAVREEENVHLLRESGATTVITSSGAAGRLLGLAAQTPRLVEVLEDLLRVGQGLDLIERPVRPHEIGPHGSRTGGQLIVAVVRGERLLRFDDPEAAELQEGDRVVCFCNQDSPLTRGSPRRS